MPRDYLTAKRTALGLQATAATARRTGVLQTMQLDGQELMSELPMQFFERGLGAPEDLMAQRAVLSLFDEYEADCESAKRTAAATVAAMREGNALALTRLLEANPCAEWLSCVFLDQPEIKSLASGAEDAPQDVKAVLRVNLQTERERLVNYYDLLDALIRITDG